MGGRRGAATACAQRVPETFNTGKYVWPPRQITSYGVRIGLKTARCLCPAITRREKMHIISEKETAEQLGIRLQIQAIQEEYQERIAPLVKQYAELQQPPSFTVEADIFQKYIPDEVIK